MKTPLSKLVDHVSQKGNFSSLDSYVDFACRYLDFLNTEGQLQARIVCQNENEYLFFQYKEDGHFNVTRPINSRLFLACDDLDWLKNSFLETVAGAGDLSVESKERVLLQRSIYTMQQCIGSALDALPAGQSNTARKLHGDLFEKLIRLMIELLGLSCRSGTIRIPVNIDGKDVKMSFQHDLIVEKNNQTRIIGSVKTSSKDRIGKIFLDRLLHKRISGNNIPYVAIFLNDVQRKTKRNQPSRFEINSTFLPGHFKAYSILLDSLNGVYYCDIRKNMKTDAFLRDRIRTIDCFFCEDLWHFLDTDC
ncbi:MAG TPA: hypothetical protein PKE31_15105 [Pseudomonadota bacterium]|nr:hypothetical protein [Pseudomonadota bacterium]